MHRSPTPTFALSVVALGALALVACNTQPKLDVASKPAADAAASAGAAPAPVASAPVAAPAPLATQAAPPLAPGATMPADHPAVEAPPIAPGAAMPANHPPIDGMPGMQSGHGAPAAPGNATQAMAGMVKQGGEGDKAVAWVAPKSWISEPPANAMRRAQYKVPGKGGDAECVVFYFGPGQGGDPQSNAQRWGSQFVNPDGSPAVSALKTRSTDVGGMKVTYVETKGTYLEGTMAGTDVAKRPNYALLGAIVEGPDANWFVKLTGPEATVSAQHDAFESMIGSMKRGG